MRKIAIIAILAMLAAMPSFGQARRGTVKGKARSGAVARASASVIAKFNSLVKGHIFYVRAYGIRQAFIFGPANSKGKGKYVEKESYYGHEVFNYTLLPNGDFYISTGADKKKYRAHVSAERLSFDGAYYRRVSDSMEYGDAMTLIEETETEKKQEKLKVSEAATTEEKTASEPEARNEYTQPQQTARQETDTVSVSWHTDEKPSYPGGDGSMMSYLAENVKYPLVAAENGVQGRVVVEFIVEKDGSLSDVKVKRGVDPSLDREAVRVVKSMPRWNPGKKDGQPVRVRFSVPVTFRLQ